ncbi:MAG: hypothetical protein R2883_06235 [Caldisericia bacterium]
MIWTLFKRDIKTIWRESFVIFGLVTPFFMALILRTIVYFIEKNMGIPGGLSAEYSLLMSLMLIIVSPMLMGTAGGFLILDDRDQGILKTLKVTPLQTSTYLVFRLTFLTLLSAVVVLLAIPVCGLVPFTLSMIPTVLMTSLLMPLTALFIASFAGNKVEGFAMMKASGFFTMAPVAAFFIKNLWHYAFAIIPTYWSLFGFDFCVKGDPRLWLYVAVGFVFQGILIWILAKVFSAKISTN